MTSSVHLTVLHPPVTDGDEENVNNFGKMNMKVSWLHRETWQSTVI